jgi:hypothetical protein
MPSRLLLAVVAGACLAAVCARAQAPASTLPGVTVTAPGPLADEPKLRSKVESFVRGYGAPAPVGHLARWTDEVCPAVSGLSPSENAIVAERIKSLAAEVGAPVAGATRCRRTVSVFFSDQPQHVLDVIRDNAPRFLGYHYQAQTRRISTFTGAIGAWYMTATGGDVGAWIDDTDHRMPGGDAGSRIVDGLSSVFAGVVIVADTGKIRGHDISSIADYVAMVALSQSSPREGCQALPTITNLFMTDCAARSADHLTSVDLAYLRALYSTTPILRPDLQRAQLVATMTSSLRR